VRGDVLGIDPLREAFAEVGEGFAALQRIHAQASSTFRERK